MCSKNAAAGFVTPMLHEWYAPSRTLPDGAFSRLAQHVPITTTGEPVTYLNVDGTGVTER